MSHQSNKLIFEKSPYLQQHAHNPIQWYPWGQEAFDLAKSLERPIFLSIGYSTCHWCHVMEKESFSDMQVASLMNSCFVCIKVDKEELPDVDALYMEFAQMLMSSSAGWPLNVILTPELKPFYAMTYLPPHNSSGRLGLYEITQYIQQMWGAEGREKIYAQAEEVLTLYKQMQQELAKKVTAEPESVSYVFQKCLSHYDPAYGGKKGAPKFPYSYLISFFLEYHQIFQSPHALEMSEVTLTMMFQGGIYDHLQGGFARYSIDDKWMIPHFEKMLSDNALLAKSYLEAFLLTKQPFYKKVCLEILDFLVHQLRQESGGFACAIDADTDGHEGLYYTWSEKEIDAALAPLEARRFKEFFNITSEGNFEGRNVLFQSVSLEEFAEEKKLSFPELELELHGICQKLLHERSKRPSPFIDKKIILCWNCQVLDVLFIAGHSFAREDFLRIARQTMEYLWTKFYQEGILYRRCYDHQVRHVGNLEDYAWMIKACLTFFKYGEDFIFYQRAQTLMDDVLKFFASPEGFYFTFSSMEGLLVRRIQRQDGAEPAAQSVLCSSLIEFVKMTSCRKYREHLEVVFSSGSDFAARFPENFISYHHMRMHDHHPKSCVMVVALDAELTLKKEIIAFLSTEYLPFVTCVWKRSDEIELFAEKPLIDGQTTVYICSKEKCFSACLTIDDVKKTISYL